MNEQLHTTPEGHPTNSRPQPTPNRSIRQKLWRPCIVLRDDSLQDAANLADPDLIAAEIVEDLEAALEEFRALADSLQSVDLTVDPETAVPE